MHVFQRGLVGGALSIAVAYSASAHSPVFDCFIDDADTILCEGGFSDGASAEGVSVRVLDRDDRVLIDGKIDSEGRFSFQKPQQDYYVLFDAGSGHTVTVFGADIAE